jgi:hypothetical protein
MQREGIEAGWPRRRLRLGSREPCARSRTRRKAVFGVSGWPISLKNRGFQAIPMQPSVRVRFWQFDSPVGGQKTEFEGTFRVD